MKKIFFIAFILAGLISCKKEMQKVEPTQSSPELMIKSAFEEASTIKLEPGDMEVAIRSDYVKTKYDEFKGSFNVIGKVVEGVCDGDLRVSSYSVPINNTIFYGDAEVEEDLKASSINIFGNAVNFSLSGSSSFDDFNEELYVPSLMDVKLENYSEIDQGSGFKVSWIPDDNTTSSVYVVLQYNPEAFANETSRELNPDVETKMFSFNQEDGHCVIEPSDLESFPEGAKLDVYIGRGNAMLHDINGHRLHLMAVNITTVRGLLMN